MQVAAEVYLFEYVKLTLSLSYAELMIKLELHSKILTHCISTLFYDGQRVENT